MKSLQKEFDVFVENLPAFKERLNSVFLGNFNKIFDRDDFVVQWNQLNNEDKSTVLYFDENIYKTLRQKIDVSEFDFLFEIPQDFDGSYPEPIHKWIEASSKKQFLLLRREAKNGVFEKFFNAETTKQAESQNRDTRHQVAVDYLVSLKKQDTSQNWYNRLDALDNTSISFHYTYHFFAKLEDEFNGYKKIKEKIQLPEILKIWSGMIDENSYKEQFAMFEQEMKTKDRTLYLVTLEKYPMLKKAQEVQKPLNKNQFISLKEQASNTEFEDFFNHDTTEKMIHSMPYKRKDYMFVYFRDRFLKENKKKNVKP